MLGLIELSWSSTCQAGRALVGQSQCWVWFLAPHNLGVVAHIVVLALSSQKLHPPTLLTQTVSRILYTHLPRMFLILGQKQDRFLKGPVVPALGSTYSLESSCLPTYPFVLTPDAHSLVFSLTESLVDERFLHRPCSLVWGLDICRLFHPSCHQRCFNQYK